MNSENKIAIDIVLLLPKEVNDLCVRINEKSDQSKYVSFRDGHHPHISLMMACLFESEIDSIKKELQSIAHEQPSLHLTLTGLNVGDFNWLALEKSSELLGLHKKFFNLLDKFSKNIAKSEHFYKPEIPEETSNFLHHFNNFRKKFSNDNYNPHISIGEDVIYEIIDPVTFISNTIGLFQMGKHGTCKNELAKFELELI